MDKEYFDKVREKFSHSLTPELASKFQKITTVLDVYAELNKIQEKQAKSKSMRNLKRLEPFLLNFTTYSKIIGIFFDLSGASGIMSCIWGPLIYLVQFAADRISYFDTIVDAIKSIGEKLPRFANYEETFRTNPRVLQALAWVYEDILEFYAKALEFSRIKPLDQLLRPLWSNFQKHQLPSILQRLERNSSIIDNAASASDMLEASRFRLEARAEIEAARKERMMRSLRESLSPVHYSLLEAQRRCDLILHSNPDAGTWLFLEPEFLSWKDDSTQDILWLSGIPGSGKTVLSYLTLDHLRSHKPCPFSATIGIFLTYQDRNINYPQSVLRTLIYEISDQDQTLASIAYEDHELRSSGLRLSSATLESKIEGLVTALEKRIFYIVLDGIDEWEEDERKCLLLVFMRLVNTGRIRLLLSSRNLTDIRNILSSNSHKELVVNMNNEKDVKAYASIMSQELAMKLRLQDHEATEIASIVADAAKGMVLYVRLVFSSLKRQVNPCQLPEVLHNLPDGLEAAYGRIIQDIECRSSGPDGQIARAVLEYLVSAYGSARIIDLQHALFIGASDTGLKDENSRIHVEFEAVCGPIIEVKDDLIIFVHFSAKEYLVSKKSGPFLDLQYAHTMMSIRCLTYLSFDSLSSNVPDQQLEINIERGDYTWLSYAKYYWFKHLFEASKGKSNVTGDLLYCLRRFLQLYERPQEPLAAAKFVCPLEFGLSSFKTFHDIYPTLTQVALYNSQGKHNRRLEDPLSLSSIVQRVYNNIEKLANRSPASFQVLTPFYGNYIYKCPDTSCRKHIDGFQSSAERDEHSQLHAKSEQLLQTLHTTNPEETERGNVLPEEFVDRTLNNLSLSYGRKHRGHFPRQQRITFLLGNPDNAGEALIDSVKKNEVEITRELLDNAAKNVGGNYVNISLIEAIKRGLVKITHLLLEKDADVNFKDMIGDSPLIYATKRGFVEIAQLLLAKDADVNLKDTFGDSPLIHAVKGGFVEIAQLLLESGAEYNGESGNSPIIYAAGGGYVEIVHLLLETGADVNCNDKSGNSPLIYAARGGFVETVQLLLENRADVDFKDKSGNSPIIYAARNGFVGIVQLLLEKGAYVGPNDKSWNSALVEAIQSRSVERAQLLVERGVDIHFQDNDGNSPLINATKDGLVEIVRPLLEKGADADFKDKSGNSSLIYAAEKGFVEIVQLLLEKGADVNTKDKDGRSPLIYAAKKGFVEIVQLLLEKDADVNIKDASGNSPLIYAACNGFVEIVQLLLEKDADVNIKDLFGKSPLIYAAQNDFVEIMQLLLEKDVDVNITAFFGESPLIYAAQNGFVEIVQLLLEKDADANIKDMLGDSPLIYAAQKGFVEIIQLLLEKGADVNIEGEGGKNPLIDAVQKGFVETVRLLLEKNADVNIKNIYNGSPLIYAAENGFVEIVQLLLEKDADVNSKNNNGNSSLIYAAKKGYVEIVQLLLEKDADVNSKDNNGNSSLIYAAVGGFVEIVQLLLEKDADVNIKGTSDNSPLIYATRRRFVEIVQLLLEKGADINQKDTYRNSPLIYAAVCGFAEIVQLLLEKDADVNIKDASGNSPLTYAAKKGFVEIVQLLLEKNSDVNIKDSGGSSPLIYAAEKGFVEIVQLLLEKGADINIKDKDGHSPLIYAAKGRFVEIVQLLLKKNANVNTTDKYRDSPLSYAAVKGSVEIVRLLLEKNANVNTKNTRGRTPLNYATEGRHVEIVQLLLEKDANANAEDRRGDTPFTHAVRSENIEMVRILLASGAQTDPSGLNRISPLMIAAQKANIELVRLLLEHGANVNAKNKYGNTPLYFALLKNQRENALCAKLLLENGANPKELVQGKYLWQRSGAEALSKYENINLETYAYPPENQDNNNM